MNIVRTLILSALGVGALAFATPSQADEQIYVHGRTYYNDDGYRYHHHHHYYSDWDRNHRSRVIISNGDDAGVSVAFGGHRRYHHRHYYQRDWDR